MKFATGTFDEGAFYARSPGFCIAAEKPLGSREKYATPDCAVHGAGLVSQLSGFNK